MRTNRARALMEAGNVAVNAWLSNGSPYAAEVVGHCGFDAVTVDLQHGMLGRDSLVPLLAAISATPAVPMVRVGSSDPAEIGWVLDAGAYGVIVPSVDTPVRAREVVAAARYPPLGRRSFGPSRGLLYGGADYTARATEEVMVWLMVESVEALGHLDDILATDGAYGVYLGPNDLALDMGLAPGGVMAPEVEQAAVRVQERAAVHGLRAGIFCADGQQARAWADRGFSLVTPGNDMSMIRAAAAERIGHVRGAPGARAGSGY